MRTCHTCNYYLKGNTECLKAAGIQGYKLIRSQGWKGTCNQYNNAKISDPDFSLYSELTT